MTITLTGGNSFALQARLNELAADFIKEQGALALERLDAEEVDMPVILEAVQSLPFLATRKMVILRGLSSNKPAAEAIEQIIDSTGESTDLVIVEPSPDKRGKYYKALQKGTDVEVYEELDARGLAKWVSEKAKKLGGSISYEDAGYLVDRIGVNQQALASELDKLLTYSPKITKDTINLLTEPSPQSKIFDLLDAAFAGDKQKALELYEDQRAQRIEPQVILAMLAWQLKVLAAARLSEGRAVAEIAKDFGLNPYVVGKSARLSKKTSLVQLRELIKEALEIDYKSKTVTYDLDEALKNYLISIS